MTEEGSLNPHETWTASSDDQLLASIVNLLEDWSPDSQLSQSSLSIPNGLQIGQSTDLSQFMKYILRFSDIQHELPSAAQRLLDDLLRSATPQQIGIIFNGYADLYALKFCIIRYSDDDKIQDPTWFEGNSQAIDQLGCPRKVIYAIYYDKSFKFAPYYGAYINGQLESFFSTDTRRIVEIIDNSVQKDNNEKIQNPNPPLHETNQKSINTTCVEESQIFQDTSNQNGDFMTVLQLTEASDVAESMETHDQQRSTTYNFNEGKLVSQNAIANREPLEDNIKRRLEYSSKNLSAHTPKFSHQTSTKSPTAVVIHTLTMVGITQKYNPPLVKKQPRSHRRPRMLTDLAKKNCPLVQAGKPNEQCKYPEVEVPDNDDVELYLSVRATTEYQHPHPCQIVGPEKVVVDWTLMKDNDERTCLKYDPGSFDPTSGTVFLKITNDERKKRRKKIKVYLIKRKICGPFIQDAMNSEDLRLVKLEFQLCIKDCSGQYQMVSDPSYTCAIEPTDGDVTIDETKIEPKALCELGGETITIPLSVKCRKKDFRVELNETQLKSDKFVIHGKNLSLTSLAKSATNPELHVVIKRIEYVEETTEMRENLFYDDYLPYVTHGECEHRY